MIQPTRCPKCGAWVYWNMDVTASYCVCLCGYDSRNITYVTSNRTIRTESITIGTTMLKEESEGK